jgi:hypothetical protein
MASDTRMDDSPIVSWRRRLPIKDQKVRMIRILTTFHVCESESFGSTGGHVSCQPPDHQEYVYYHTDSSFLY